MENITNNTDIIPTIGASIGTVWTVAITMLILGVGLGFLLPILVKKIRRAGKVLVLWVDPDAMGYKLSYEKRNGNEISKPEGTYLLNGASRWTGKLHSLWIIHYRHGFNLKTPSDSIPGSTMRAQTDAELFDSNPGMRLLTIANPRAYYDAVARNEAADALNANSIKDPWYANYVGLAFIALFIILAIIVFIAWKVH